MAGEDEREAKRKRYTSRIITIEVGPAKEALTIQEDFLQEDSPFFQAALEKKWGVILLPEEDVNTVTAYIHWLYCKDIVRSVSEHSGRNFCFLASLYVFGEKIQSNGLCNSVLSEFLKFIDGFDGQSTKPGPQAARILYEGTLPGAPIRRFLVEAYAERGVPLADFASVRDQYPLGFLADLSLELLARQGPSPFQSMYARKEKWEKK